jgi:TolB-like protein/DNA-binding winged helix-turn-helix (wHTH) protein/Tfp pilus assembly protein PilF
MSESTKHFYEFGSFRVDMLKRRLLRNGATVPLTPKAFETLLVLIEHSGQVVEKDALMEKVWPGVTVEENNLTQNISALRRALGEKREDPRYILTVPGLGYRFIAEVREMFATDQLPSTPIEQAAGEDAEYQSLISFTEAPPEAKPNWRGRWRMFIAAALVVAVALAGVTYRMSRHARGATPPANTHLKSIAILPFKPLAADQTDEYLGVGMADALITKLSSIKEITVRPTSSILRYANSDVDPIQVGSALEVNTLLDGRVQRVNDRIRVTVQLISAKDGTPLWADKFDEKYTDVFSLEDRISEKVAAALLPTLTGDQKQQLSLHYTEDADAYQSYIKGRYFWNKRTADGITKAISYFEDAIIRDPNYALAYAGLADSYTTLGILDDSSSQEMMPKARSSALKAIELDDRLAEAHASLAYVKHRFEWDWVGAEKEFRRSIELNPDYATAHQWYGWYLISVGSYDGAEKEFERARQIEPLSLYTNVTVGAAFFYSRQYDKAAAQLKRVVEMDPSFGIAHSWLARTYEQTGRFDEAISETQKVIKIGGGTAAQQAALGYAYSVSGQQAEAHRVLAELQHASKDRYIPPYSLASIYAGLGQKDRAFEWLEKALKDRDNSMVFLSVDQRLEGLHSDPRFTELVKRVGIPQ